MMDKCLSALLLHPHSAHPLFFVASRLMTHCLAHMSEVEFAGWVSGVPGSVASRSGVFERLRYSYTFQDSLLANALMLVSNMRREITRNANGGSRA